jgi:hypothetical protein
MLLIIAINLFSSKTLFQQQLQHLQISRFEVLNGSDYEYGYMTPCTLVDV